MIEHYYEKGKIRRRQYRIYCDTCHALISDSGPGKDKLPWGTDNVCPKCKGEIHKDEPPKNQD